MTDDINSKIIPTILFWTYFAIGLLTEGFILWLFPNTGLGGLICWPTAILLSLVFAFGLMRVHKKVKSRRLTAICFGSFLLIQVSTQLLLTPQEYGGEPIDQISKAILTFKRFDKIDYTDFSKLNQFERVAYIFKNKKSLPDSYLILSLDSVNEHQLPGEPDYYAKSKTYLIEKRKGKKSWRSKELVLVETDSTTIIIQKNGPRDSTVYMTINGLLRDGIGGGMGNNLSIFCIEDDLKLTTGMQEVFYNILSLTKKSGE